MIPNRVDGIGQPLNVFYYILYFAVPVNAGLVVYTFKASPFHDDYNIYIFGSLCFIMIIIIGRLDTLYPDIPMKTQIQLGREEIIVDRIVLGNEGRAGDDKKLDIDESMIGLTSKQVKEKLEQAQKPPIGTRV